MIQNKVLLKSINSLFDHIYLITLERSKKRHTCIKEILEGLNYEVFWGVDGSKLNLSKIREEGLYDPDLARRKIPIGRELVLGEIGCALSHLEVYKDIIKKGYQNALILEDDLAVETDVTDELTQSFTELPENWDLLYLGYKDNNNRIAFPIALRILIAYPILNMVGLKKYDAKKLRCNYPRPYSEHLDLAGNHYGTHAYAVTASGAEKILAYQTPVSMEADNAIGMMCIEESIQAFRVKKRVFHQNRELATTIGGRH